MAKRGPQYEAIRALMESEGLSYPAAYRRINKERRAQYSQRSNAKRTPEQRRAEALRRRGTCDTCGGPTKMRSIARCKKCIQGIEGEPNPQPCEMWLRDKDKNVVAKSLVDLEDWMRFRHLRFRFVGGHKDYYRYAAASSGGKTVYLHRLILGLDETTELVCDHINRDTLDNRRANLRAVTQKANCANRGGRFASAP